MGTEVTLQSLFSFFGTHHSLEHLQRFSLDLSILSSSREINTDRDGLIPYRILLV